MSEDVKISATLDELVAAFTEWDRRYREQPEEFESLAEHILNNTPESYGKAAALYFVRVLLDVQFGDSPSPSVSVVVGMQPETKEDNLACAKRVAKIHLVLDEQILRRRLPG